MSLSVETGFRAGVVVARDWNVNPAEESRDRRAYRFLRCSSSLRDADTDRDFETTVASRRENVNRRKRTTGTKERSRDISLISTGRETFWR